jgi:hypothetical protein
MGAMEQRPLTSGEQELAHSMFGDALDLRRVRLVRGKWWPFQPKGIVMAPTGNIHFHPDDPNWRDDFAVSPLSLQGLLVHELTHVWQTQKGGRWFLPLMRHPFCRYAYTPDPARRFDRYGLEQQAEIVRHRFLRSRGALVPYEERLAAIALPFEPSSSSRGA